jgi:hypothetical protein
MGGLLSRRLAPHGSFIHIHSLNRLPTRDAGVSVSPWIMQLVRVTHGTRSTVASFSCCVGGWTPPHTGPAFESEPYSVPPALLDSLLARLPPCVGRQQMSQSVVLGGCRHLRQPVGAATTQRRISRRRWGAHLVWGVCRGGASSYARCGWPCCCWQVRHLSPTRGAAVRPHTPRRSPVEPACSQLRRWAQRTVQRSVRR